MISPWGNINRRLHKTSLFFVLPTYIEIILIRWLHDLIVTKLCQNRLDFKISWNQLESHNFMIPLRSEDRSHDLLLRIWFLLVPKIGSCEHIENDLLTHESLILKKRMEIEHALFSSDTLLERWKAPTNFAWYPCGRFGAKLKILC